MPTGRSILIFVKAPVAGFVKTRLTPPLPAAQAAELYQALARDTFHVACQVPDSEVYIAYQNHPAMTDPNWVLSYPLPHPLPRREREPRLVPSPLAGEGVRERGDLNWFYQEGNDLGERLVTAAARVFKRAARPLVIIGSDLPGLTSTLLEKAYVLLRVAPVVLGPSEDGGYYLIGLREPRGALFQDIRWSESTVLEQTVTKAQALGLDYKLLPRRIDLDTPDDLQRLRSDPALVALEFQHTLAVLREL